MNHAQPVTPTRALVIGAKAPVPGTVKTRLGRTIGHERAATLYHAFLRDLAARFADQSAYDVFWAYAPIAADWPTVIGCEVAAFPQEGPDWTARQRHIFSWTAARGYGHTVLMASDSPQLPRATVTDAFAALDRFGAVLLPTYDGGYSLIGQRQGVDILGATPMSTRTVFDDLCDTATRTGVTLETLAPTWDVDEEGDLTRLAHYLALTGGHDAPATAAAFAWLQSSGTAMTPATPAMQYAGGAI